MQRIHSVLLLAVIGAALAGCSTASSRLRQHSALIASLPPETAGKLERGIVEPGYTPQMVFVALGRPSSPVNASPEATRDGTWTYRSFHTNDRDFVRAGFRRRVIFDPVRKSDVIITEPVDARSFPHLQDQAVRVTFRDGRVTDVQRSAE
jgi:hypothetical protein